MLIDTHAHLDFNNFDEDRDQIIARANDAGVTTILNVGTDFSSSQCSITLAETYAQIFASVGIHPHDAEVISEDMFAQFETMCVHPKVKAIGEIGLDYYRNRSPHDLQRAMFIQFLKLHKKTGLPIIIHSRDSYDDVLNIIRSEVGGSINGVLHCFSADERIIREALQIGLHISFAGQVSYKKNELLQRLVSLVPDDRLLLETDCPFLSPQSYRGKRNEPAYLLETARFIAKLRGVSLQDVARYTSLNASKLFSLSKEDPSNNHFVYKIRNSLYINVTGNCSSDCVFCPRRINKIIKGHDLTLAHDPSVDEVMSAIAAYEKGFSEICFCGLGEPFLRVDFIKEVSRCIRESYPDVQIRIDTNGQGNIINDRNVLPELGGLIDKICISLNAHSSEVYHAIVKPHFQVDVYAAVKAFVLKAKKVIPEVEVSCLNYPGVDVEEVRKIARGLGVAFRLRIYDELG